MKRNITRIMYSVFAVVIPVIIFFLVLKHNGYRPLFTNSVSFDTKIHEIENHRLTHVDLAAIGSSITLNNIASKVITDSISTSYYNFSAWGLQISNIKDVTIKYLLNFKPKCIIVCSSIKDFNTNGSEITLYKFLDLPFFLKHLDEYAYINNYSSMESILSRKKEEQRLRYHTIDYATLRYDKYGGVLLNMPRKYISSSRWNSQIPFPTPYYNYQYAQLQKLSAILKGDHIKFIFIQAPIRQAYLKDPKIKHEVDQHVVNCRSAVESNGGIYLNFHDKAIFSNDSLFVDQFHLSGAGADLLTKEVTKALKHLIK